MSKRPATVVDINRLPLDAVAAHRGRRPADRRARAQLRCRAPRRRRARLSGAREALLSGASAQLRNMATTGGNLLQRTRCVYFRDTAGACNKREPGAAAPRSAASTAISPILGTSDHCIATNPSDQNVALAALEASVKSATCRASEGRRSADFYLDAGRYAAAGDGARAGRPRHLRDLPPPLAGARKRRTSSCVTAHPMSLRWRPPRSSQPLTNEAIERVRIALGGVGTLPWRSREAEALLDRGRSRPRERSRGAAETTARRRPQPQNAFKVELADAASSMR